MESLRCDNLSKRFDGVLALDGVSLTFAPNEIAAIVGPNGAGKTTLFNVITGRIEPDSGRWFLGDRELTGLSLHQIARGGVGRTFQELRLLRKLTVLENVMLARPEQRGERLWISLLGIGVSREESANRKASLDLLEFIGLVDHAGVNASALSYGQQKLLTVACCLAMESRVLLLDEPVAGLHPSMADRMRGVLSQLRDQGKVVVFIEHDLDVVRALADQLIVMHHGKVIAHGTSATVLEQPEILDAYVG